MNTTGDKRKSESGVAWKGLKVTMKSWNDLNNKQSIIDKND